ncbi:MAG: hypothetical protein ACUVSY_13160 [Roseiflexus sp.]
MTNASESSPSSPPSSPQPVRRRSSVSDFFARLLAAFFVILITTSITLLVTGAALLWLGFTPATPVEIDAARMQVATLEAHNATMVSRADALATEVADLARRAGNDRETLSDIRLVIDDVRTLREQVREQLTAVVAQNATLVADARAGRDQVAAFATAEAGRAVLLQELDRRSQRIERFLQRLSDIAGDAALDLQRPSPVAPAIAPTATVLVDVVVTPTLTATPIPEVTSTATPVTPAVVATDVPVLETVTPRATQTAQVTPATP